MGIKKKTDTGKMIMSLIPGVNVISAIVHDDPWDLIPGAGLVQGVAHAGDLPIAERRLVELRNQLNRLYNQKEEINDEIVDIEENIEELRDMQEELEVKMEERQEWTYVAQKI